MKIQYAGPKAIFTRQGVDFDNNKEDKYVYLNIAIQIFKAFEHEYTPGEKYVYNNSSKRLSDSETLEFIRATFSNHSKLLEQAKEQANEFFIQEKEQAKKHQALISEEEYNSWIKNIELMKEYTIQRHFNKNIYYTVIDRIGKRMKDRNIGEIHTPMYQKFMHVLHSLQGVLAKKPNPLSASLDIYSKNDKLMIQLIVK